MEWLSGTVITNILLACILYEVAKMREETGRKGGT
jgi:hypothetical protein